MSSATTSGLLPCRSKSKARRTAVLSEEPYGMPLRWTCARAVQTLVDQQVLPALRALLPDDPHVDERAALIHSQGLGIVVGRYLLRLEPLASMNFDDLVVAVGRTVQDYIDRPLPDPPSGRTG